VAAGPQAIGQGGRCAECRDARLFRNFIMARENAALNSNCTRYGNGIVGSEAFKEPDLTK
jgi:uncharacterized protein (DUF983 family)